MKISAQTNKTTYSSKSSKNCIDATVDNKTKLITGLTLTIDGEVKVFKGDLQKAWKQIIKILK
jgi:hypothetical protein